jgi:hypothetical protein
MARSGAQRLEQEELQAEPRKKKERNLLELGFMQIPNIVSAPRVPEAELLKYEQTALMGKKPGLNWRQFLRQVLESPLPGSSSIDDYVKAAVSARPIPVEEPESVPRIIKEMVATKVPGQPRLDEASVKDAIKLAAYLESGRINFRKDWCGEGQVV